MKIKETIIHEQISDVVFPNPLTPGMVEGDSGIFFLKRDTGIAF